MDRVFIMSLIRHLLTGAGTWIAGQGYVTHDEWNAGVGALLVLVGLVWSFIEKRRAKK